MKTVLVNRDTDFTFYFNMLLESPRHGNVEAFFFEAWPNELTNDQLHQNLDAYKTGDHSTLEHRSLKPDH